MLSLHTILLCIIPYYAYCFTMLCMKFVICLSIYLSHNHVISVYFMVSYIRISNRYKVVYRPIMSVWRASALWNNLEFTLFSCHILPLFTFIPYFLILGWILLKFSQTLWFWSKGKKIVKIMSRDHRSAVIFLSICRIFCVKYLTKFLLFCGRNGKIFLFFTCFQGFQVSAPVKKLTISGDPEINVC